MQYWDLHNIDITAFDGNLMASLRKYNFGVNFTYTGLAKLETSVVFTSMYCLSSNSTLFVMNYRQSFFYSVYRMACSHYSNVVFYTFYYTNIAKLKINSKKKMSIFKMQGFDRVKPCYSVEGMFTERHVK